jgi:hypothetical protein
MQEMVHQMQRDKKAYPPVLVLSPGISDLDDGTSNFLDSLRQRDPIAAVFDDLLTAGLATKRWEERKTAADDQRSQIRPSTSTTGLFDPGRRFLHRRLPQLEMSPEQMQVQLQSAHREDPSLQGEFDALEAFFDHWFERGPAIDGAGGATSDLVMRKRRAAEKL